MAAVSSAWSKPGAWALESEEIDQNDKAGGYASSTDSHHSASSDFPSLSAAATAKIPKKKSKKQTLTLAEFSTTSFKSSSDEPLVLPTGPRERSSEELDRSRLGGGFRYSSYNSDGSRGGGGRGSDESRRGPREPRVLDSGPSRADEVDNWGSMKKSVGVGSERRGERFFDSQSKADESESWISAKKSYAVPPPNEGRRERRGYDFGSNGSGVDSDNWGRKREEIGGRGLDSDSWGRKREENGGRGLDADTWGKKREDNGGSGRPRLVLQPRSVPLDNAKNGEEEKKGSKGGNPFGEARPREEVLKEKGKDWKEIDEKLEAVKIKEAVLPVGRKGNGLEDRTEGAWRKPDAPPRYCFDS